MEVPESEVLRCLGYGGATAEARVSDLIGRLTDELAACLRPQSAFRVLDCRIDPLVVTLGGMTVKSASLAAHMKGSRRAALLAATLGAGPDSLIRRYSVRDMEKAAVIQAICAVMIETYCDQVEGEMTLEDLCHTPRFSPGYGDFDLTHQKDILRMLDCGSMGLTLTDGYMLIPSKSVTAVIGLTKEKTRAGGKCESCADERCAFREIR